LNNSLQIGMNRYVLGDLYIIEKNRAYNMHIKKTYHVNQELLKSFNAVGELDLYILIDRSIYILCNIVYFY